MGSTVKLSTPELLYGRTKAMRIAVGQLCHGYSREHENVLARFKLSNGLISFYKMLFANQNRVQIFENVVWHPRLIFVLTSDLSNNQVSREDPLVARRWLHRSTRRELLIAYRILNVAHLGGSNRCSVLPGFVDVQRYILQKLRRVDKWSGEVICHC
jgi:hypothetical protein